MNHLLFLQSLLFMNFGHNQFIDYQVGNCLAMKTEGNIGRFNRVFNTGPLSPTDIEHIKVFFDNMPFTWIIDAQDRQNRQLLEDSSFFFKGYFPALFLNLQQLSCATQTDITVKEAVEKDDFNIWVSLTSQIYNYVENKAEFIKALQFLKNRAQENIKFYIGYYHGEPASTCMLIYHEDHVSIHFVGTLKQFRRNGVGSAIIALPLLLAKDQGYHAALLMASPEGLPLAQKVGFEEYTTYAIYGNY
ncbi:MAG: hypothetical protein BWY54_00211 [Candidatus Dependentiae bacterium ADurb.Bin331]|nr:MAG: hypothetical protein BWY54_00211 [Candidatus Dependentiae bacterium ADurb.Bin331]